MADLTQRQAGLRQRQAQAEARKRRTMLWLAGGLVVAAIPLAGLFYREIKESALAAQAGIKPSFAGRRGGNFEAESPQAMQENAPPAPAAATGNFLDYVRTLPESKPSPKPAPPRPAAAPKQPVAPAPPPIKKTLWKPTAMKFPPRRAGASFYKIPLIKGGPAWAPGKPMDPMAPKPNYGAGAGNWMGTGSGGSSGFSPGSSGGGSLPSQVLSGP